MAGLALTAGVALTAPLGAALAAAPPERRIPPSVLVELERIEDAFELALADDCAAELCASRGCVYVDHAVSDRPRRRALPGLGVEAAEEDTPTQEYLTRARCSFAHEEALETETAAVLVQRLQTRLTHGWTVVSVDHAVLPPLPAPPEPEPEPEPEVPEAPEAWSSEVAGRELWSSLLPHFFWMIGVGLVTLAATMLIWAGRRVGQASIEEQALLAELTQPPPPEPAPEAVVTEEPGEDLAVAAQAAQWKARLAALDPSAPDRELEALITERLRAGDTPLLAGAVMRFGDRFLAAFPQGEGLGPAKLALAEHLRTVDPTALPDDPTFYAALQRHSLAAALSAQEDARAIAGLHADFGAAGLVGFIRRLPARIGAVAFALAAPVTQSEAVALLSARQVAGLAAPLLRSNRISPEEMSTLTGALVAEGTDPTAPLNAEITDRGLPFDAPGALAVLLPRLGADLRGVLFGAALDRFGGTLPAWYREIFIPDMLSALPREARADLLLGVDVLPLAAWLSLAERRAELLSDMPAALRTSVEAQSVFPSRERQLALAAQARRSLARGFGDQLARAGIPLARVIGPSELP